MEVVLGLPRCQLVKIVPEKIGLENLPEKTAGYLL
jgi:hypothetical protein